MKKPTGQKTILLDLINEIEELIDILDNDKEHECEHCTTKIKNGTLAWAIDFMINGGKVRHESWNDSSYCKATVCDHGMMTIYDKHEKECFLLYVSGFYPYDESINKDLV